MNNSQRLKILMDTDRSIFTLKNIQELWGMDPNTAKITAGRMAAKGIIYRYARGYYGLRKDFDANEFANIIVTPSYVSLQTALFTHGVSFQISNFITSTALINYQRKINNHLFKYYAMKKPLFFNLEGIEYKSNYAIAKPERALLDCFYFGILPSIDNPEKINFSYLKELLRFYPKSISKHVNKIPKEKA